MKKAGIKLNNLQIRGGVTTKRSKNYSASSVTSCAGDTKCRF